LKAVWALADARFATGLQITE